VGEQRGVEGADVVGEEGFLVVDEFFPHGAAPAFVA